MENGDTHMDRDLSLDNNSIRGIWQIPHANRNFTLAHLHHHRCTGTHHGICFDTAFAEITGQLVEKVTPD